MNIFMERINDLKGQVDTLTKERDSAIIRNGELKKALYDCRAERDQARKELENAKNGSYFQYTHAINQAVAERNDARAECEHLSGKLEHLSTVCDELRWERRTAEKAAADARDQRDKAVEERDDWKELADAREGPDNLDHLAAESAAKERDEAIRERDAFKEELSVASLTHNLKRDALLDQIDDWKDTADARKKEMDSLGFLLADARRERDDALDELDDLRSVRDTIVQQRNSYWADLVDARRHVSEAREELDKAKADRDLLRGQRDLLAKECTFFTGRAFHNTAVGRPYPSTACPIAYPESARKDGQGPFPPSCRKPCCHPGSQH